MNYKGVIIEESLENKDVLDDITIVSTEVKPVTAEHQTPWVKQWTLHAVKIPENKSDIVANNIRDSLDKKHNWYADYKNNKWHYIIFKDKVFKVGRTSAQEYQEAKKHGMSLGIPEYQLDFSPENK